MKRSTTSNGSLPKKKRRRYSQSYLALGFICSPENNSLPLCLICEKTFSNDSMKPSKMKAHTARMHPNQDLNLDFFTNLKNKYLLRSKTPDICSSQPIHKSFCAPNYEGGLEASYNISFLIAKAGYPHTIGKNLILPAVREIISTVMKMDPESILNSIPLSSTTVQRRVDEMAEDIKNTLLSELRTNHFSVQIDELTYAKMSILMIYVRYYSSSKQEIAEEFLCAEQLDNHTSGEHIFNCFEKILQQYKIPINNITVASCDGGSKLIAKYREFLTFLKNKVPDICTMHCILHRQHLIGKNINEQLHTVLQLCIKAINTIKTNDSLFAKLSDNNNETYNHLLLHTEVRWLSKGNCLQSFIDIFSSVIEFINEIDKSMEIQLTEFKKHIFYLTDIFSLINDIQMKLQKKDINLIQIRSIIQEFYSKIDLLISELKQTDFHSFNNLNQLSIIEKDSICIKNILLYTDHLIQIKEDLNVRFNDIENLDVPNWITQPFECDISEIDLSLNDELFELQKDQESKALFHRNGYAKFWNHNDIRQKYIKLKTIAEPIFLAVPSSYLVDAGFSHVNNLLRRTRFNIAERGDLRILLSNLTPDIRNIAQTHSSQNFVSLT